MFIPMRILITIGMLCLLFAGIILVCIAGDKHSWKAAVTGFICIATFFILVIFDSSGLLY